MLIMGSGVGSGENITGELKISFVEWTTSTLGYVCQRLTCHIISELICNDENLLLCKTILFS